MKGSIRTFVIVLAMATILASVATVGAVAAAGGQGKGHHQSSSDPPSLPLVMANDVNSDGLPNYGDSVTFNVSATVTYPWVQLTCYQGGDWVTNQYVAFYAGYPAPPVFPLSSWKWTGGAADCNARLFDSSNDKTLATTSFHVDA